MRIFDYLEEYDYEQLLFAQDRESGLKAIIAIHDTTLGPALGGTRMWTYNSEKEAIIDSLRLARAMTYKAAAAGLNLGGGKTVIIGDPTKDKSEALFRALGRYIQSLDGRYITAEDVGTSVQDMDWVHLETDYVTGISPVFGSGGDPSPATAYGTYIGMKAAAKVAFGDSSLTGKTIAVQGLGNVACNLLKYLHEEGANLIVTDIIEEKIKSVVKKYGAKTVGANEIYSVDCDIFSPNALGSIINDDTIPRLKAKLIAGAANNQLKEEYHGNILYDKGIIYAPDYVINAGGLINVADELEIFNQKRAKKKTEKIYDNILKVFEIVERDKIPSNIAVNRLVEERIEKMRKVRSNFIRNEKNTLVALKNR
ncbi:MAG: Leu/Phe/Val dehydrogenase [Vulcanibacillus sp.]